MKRIEKNESFNSILVRLKAYWVILLHSLLLRFQFHTGSIKREMRLTPSIWTTLVSIPYWFD